MIFALLRPSGLIHDRAVFDARPASGAQIHFDASGAFSHLDLEIARGAFNGLQIRVCDQLDVQMPADLDQYGRDDSHGAVVGGKCLVQLRHDAPDGGRFFEQVNVISGIRQIQGGLHPRNTAADDKNRSDNIL